MLQQFGRWYRKYLSDSQAIFLAILLVAGFATVIFMGNMLLPVFAAIVIAYLLDDVVGLMERRGTPRFRAVLLVYCVFIAMLAFVFFGFVPLLSGQLAQLVRELPHMIGQGQQALMRLPEHYPFITEDQIREFTAAIRAQLGELGKSAVSVSIVSLTRLITLVVYLIVLPLLVFFFLKDKHLILTWFSSLLPRERALMTRVWNEMDQQIGNYVRGKFWEMLIVGGVCSVAFLLLGLNYAMLLGFLVGLSVIVPYVGATIVTFPVLIIAYFQWHWSSEFLYIAGAYAMIQALDASVLVPLLFSEAVNLHPIAIIVAVLFFGGVWGFWGVFFAIPLATLVQVIFNAWPRNPLGSDKAVGG